MAADTATMNAVRGLTRVSNRSVNLQLLSPVEEILGLTRSVVCSCWQQFRKPSQSLPCICCATCSSSR